MPAPPTTLSGDQLMQGEIVAAKYRLVERCGSGGMGSVWRATHLGLDSTVAIKFLHGSVSRQSEARARFEQEAKICARLGDESHHVVRVTDHGITERGRPFLVMELLKGESLADRLEREGSLPLSLAAAITAQLCRALHVAHVAGVVHRDLKPANVFLSRSGAAADDGVLVKLLDFGVAKATLAMEDLGVTRAGFIVGTPAYMSPEQITAEKFLDARADLWSVVAIVYRMVVGAPPFGSGGIADLGKRITRDEPVAPSQLVADLPKAFDAWIARGLEKGRDDRFQTTTDLADSLTEVARGAHPAGSAANDGFENAGAMLRVGNARDDRTAEARPAETTAEARPAETTHAEMRAAEATNSSPRTSTAPRLSEGSAEDWRPPRSASPTWILAALVVIALAAAGFLYARARGMFATSNEPTASLEPTPISSVAPPTVVEDAGAAAVPPSASATASSASSKPSAVPPPKKPATSVAVIAGKPIADAGLHAQGSSDASASPDPTATPTATAPKPDEEF